jgi:hypothetical protein
LVWLGFGLRSLCCPFSLMLGSGSGLASMASLPVRHFPPYHFILARPKRLRVKRGHPRLETYDAQIAQSQLEGQVERHDALARISWYVISIEAPFRSILPLRPFLPTFPPSLIPFPGAGVQ